MNDQVLNRPIITRSQAKARELRRYYTGRPCKHGHVAERKVSSGRCLRCHAVDSLRREAQSVAEGICRQTGCHTPVTPDRRYCDHCTGRRRRHYEANKATYQTRANMRRAARLLAIPSRAFRGETDGEREANRERLRRRVSDGSKAVRDLVTSHYWLTLVQREEDKKLLSECFGIALHDDHAVPLSAGGEHHPDNLELMPARLNLSKSSKTDWLPPEPKFYRVSHMTSRGGSTYEQIDYHYHMTNEG